MWEQINILCPAAQPTHMIMDFELAAISSFELEWPLTNVKGCFFSLDTELMAQDTVSRSTISLYE